MARNSILINITNDVFDIVSRLKKINRDYFVVFNLKKQKFEVHCKNQVGGTYCLTSPYSQLDERTFYLVLSSRIENMNSTLQEIEEQNRVQENRNHEIEKNEFASNFEELMRKNTKI